jgi:predicted amidohydrolase
MKIVVGVVQARPAVLDLAACIDRACSWIGEAGRRGVQLVAFPEAWIPCYPLWCDGGSFAKWGNPAAKRLHARLLENSLVVRSPETDALCAAARKAGVAVVMGANERESFGGSIYNSLVFIDEEGRVVATRRKLVPTHGERLVWSAGDAAHLDAHRLAQARVGGLICWEHWMPLARHVLHVAGEEIHVAAWPHGGEHHQLASRHYAFEGRCFVLAAAMVLSKSDLPADFELADDYHDGPDELLAGGSAIIGPDGAYVVAPTFAREELLVAEVDLARAREEKLTLDVAGHYARPELFELRVRRGRPAHLREDAAAPPAGVQRPAHARLDVQRNRTGEEGEEEV